MADKHEQIRALRAKADRTQFPAEAATCRRLADALEEKYGRHPEHRFEEAQPTFDGLRRQMRDDFEAQARAQGEVLIDLMFGPDEQGHTTTTGRFRSGRTFIFTVDL